MRYLLYNALFCIALPACTTTPALKPCNFYMENGHRVSWQGYLPVVVNIGDSVPREALPAITRAANDWNAAFGAELIRLSSTGTSTIHWDTTWSREPKIQAYTSAYWTGSMMWQADIDINGVNYIWDTNDEVNPAAHDLESVMVHEFGHLLGLMHDSASNSVMQPTLEAKFTEAFKFRRFPSAANIADLHCEY